MIASTPGGRLTASATQSHRRGQLHPQRRATEEPAQSGSEGAIACASGVSGKGALELQGRSCKKSSKKNRHGRRCTYYVPLGSFTHADKAGTNSLHFSGRLHGRKLAKGSYRLQAIAHDAAGNGPASLKGFKIR